MDERYQRLEAQLRAALGNELAAWSPDGLGGLTWEAADPGDRPWQRLAIVAADAGNVRLRLAPLRISFVRVASSEQESPLGELLFPSELPGPALVHLMREQVPALVAALESAGLPPPAVLGPDARDRLSALRDLLEWGALLVEAGRRRAEPVVLVRDGLLRSPSFPQEALERVGRALEDALAATGNRLVAVAKTLPGGADLTNVLLVAGVLGRIPRDSPLAILRVPDALERLLFPRAFRIASRLAPLHLVWVRATGELRAIELLHADPAARQDVLAALYGPHAAWFPAPGLPVEVAEAHLRARISALDRDWLRAAFLRQLQELEPGLAARAAAAEVLGRGGPELSPEGE